MTDLPAIFDSALEAVSAVAVALIAAGVLGVRRRVKRVQAQVENDHTTNMREENDGRHAETRRWFERLDRRLTAGDERMGRIEALLLKHEAAIDALEETTLDPHHKE